ncbi:MAG: hypothetical protein PUB03_01930, partial [bacterium]|nr:hypothetical protein [bacterium]
RQLMLTLLSIFGVTMLSIGSTFAIFTVSSKSAEYNVIKTGTLNINFAADASSTVGLNNALPMSDTNGLAQSGTTFTITNTGSLPANYSVSLKDDTDMVTQDNCSAKQLAKTNIKYSLDGSTASLLSTAIDSELISGTLKAGESKTFTLKLWIKEDATNEVLNKHYHGKIVVDAVQEGGPELATTKLIKNANPESLDYNSASDDQKNQMWTFTQEATEQLGATTDYRYIGANPNNYVKFNDELWRIIGAFDVDDGTGKIEKRLKIVRNESIGNYSWDNKDTSTGAETSDGKNGWIDARLNYLLNAGHENETYGGSLYWNRNSGNCYALQNNSTTSCDFTTTGLTEVAKEMIGDAKWYLGGTANYDSSSNGLVSHFYKYERGTTVYSGRSTNWTGKVGLIYPSDYGYATSGNDSTTRAICLATAIKTINNDCISNDWLLPSVGSIWTISPYSSDSSRVFMIYSAGQVDINIPLYARRPVLPVVYLKSTIKITSGTGSSDSPFILG